MDDHKPPTPRQLEILLLYANGSSEGKIAARLFLSQHTVHQQIKLARARLGAATVCQAVAICVAYGYLAVDGRLKVIYVPRPFDDPAPLAASPVAA